MMSFEFWQKVLEKHWGVKSKLSSLDGEFDLNFLVSSNDDDNHFVLKIMREECLQDFVDMQIQALNQLILKVPELPFPEIVDTLSGKKFIQCIDASGNNRFLWLIKKLEDYSLLGETRDDAAGEAFDKGARILGLSYPGGPEIEKCAKGGNCNKINFPRALINSNEIEFSFSGLKTSLLYFMDSYKQSDNCGLNDVAASYQKAIIDCLVVKMKLAIQLTGVNTISIAGGVAKNKLLRASIDKNLIGSKIIFPSLKYCTDNAAMISFLGEKKFELGKTSKFDFSINPNFDLKIN